MARARVTRRMTRKDGNAKATVSRSTSVSSSNGKAVVKKAKKIIPNVKSS